MDIADLDHRFSYHQPSSDAIIAQHAEVKRRQLL